ncbi:MAG: hypothetical protein WD060_07155, partial [Pirellulales bacterium]
EQVGVGCVFPALALGASWREAPPSAPKKPGRKRTSARPGTSGVVELSPCEFSDTLADFVRPPRKHRHRYHGVFAPNHKLRRAVTALAKRECREAARGRDRRALGATVTAPEGAATRSKSPVPTTPPDAKGEAHGPGGGGVSTRVPELWRRHPPDRVYYRAGAHSCDGRRQQPAHFEAVVRKRTKARMRAPA